MTSSLSRGARIAGGAAVVLLIDLWLSWYGVSLGKQFDAVAKLTGADTTASAWQVFSYTDIMLFLLSVAAIAWVAGVATGNAQAAQLKLPVMAGGAGMALIVLYRIVNQPGPNDLIKVKYGAFVGLAACIAIAYGALQDSNG